MKTTLALLLATLVAASASARFLQTDPIGTKDDMNLYTYVRNDPVDLTDPSGTKCSGDVKNANCPMDYYSDGTTTKPLTKEVREQMPKESRDRIEKQEQAMKVGYIAALKYSRHKDGGKVTIAGNKKLGIDPVKTTAAAVVTAMQNTETTGSDAQSPDGPNVPASTNQEGTMITFWNKGASYNNPLSVTFIHEALHVAISGSGSKWTDPAYNKQHQDPFDDAAQFISNGGRMPGAGFH